MATEVLPLLEAEVRTRKLATLRQNAPTEVELIPPRSGDDGKARDKAAELVGVNPRYISDAKRIKEDAPEVFTEMQAGARLSPIVGADSRRDASPKGRAPSAS